MSLAAYQILQKNMNEFEVIAIGPLQTEAQRRNRKERKKIEQNLSDLQNSVKPPNILQTERNMKEREWREYLRKNLTKTSYI